MNKYQNKRVEAYGRKWDSRKELRRYDELVLLERAKEISEIIIQPQFILAPSVVIQGRKRPPLRYTADFSYNDKNGNLVVEDVKSTATKTEAYVMRRHLLKVVHGIEIVEI